MLHPGKTGCHKPKQRAASLVSLRRLGGRSERWVTLVFAETLREQRQNVRGVAFAWTIGAVSQAGLAGAYSCKAGLLRGDNNDGDQ